MDADTAEDFTQPFYIPIGKGKLNLHTGIRGGYYLPALEPKEEEPRIEEPIPPRKELVEMKGLVLYLQRNLNEHIDIAKAKKGKYSTYK